MLFNFEMVYKTNDSTKYRIGGSLTPEDNESELFEQLKDAYKDIINREKISFQNHLIIEDNCILFSDIDVISISSILKVLSNGLNFKIKPIVSGNCKFIPSSCEPLFKMEVHRLFR